MKTRVVIGSSSWRDYQFLTPFSALLWREVIGIEPMIFLTGDWGIFQPKRHGTALHAIHSLGFNYKFLDMEKPPYEESTMAQNIRQMAAGWYEGFDDEDWIMPSDADLWPIKKDFYHQHGRFPITAYYANGDHYQTYPTCHVVMQKHTWRSMYQVDPKRLIGPQIVASLDDWKATYRQRWPWDDKNFAIWMSDQAMMTDKIKASGLAVQHIERHGHPPVDRIDRGNWQALTPSIVDAHLLRPADQPENWPRVRELFSQLLPHRLAWADSYREEYIGGY